MTYYIAEIRFNRNRNSKRKRKMGKLLTKRPAALLFTLLLFSTLVMIVPAAVGSDHSKIIESLEELSEDIRSELPKEAFQNLESAEGQRGALRGKIGAVIHQIEAGAYKGALNKLRNDISSSVMNWIADPEWEAHLLEKVNEIIELIEGVLPPNLPPVARFTESAETVLTSVIIDFNASESFDPDGSIASYFWNFGDGTNASGMIVTHAYEDDGVYMVALTVTDYRGATDTATSTKTVLNRPPMAIFTESAESAPTGEVIYFNASESYDPDGYIVGYFWDFGDGANATGVTSDHSYADEGKYTVALTVTDDDGATASANATKIAGNRPPVALFTESAETVLTDVAIEFNASSSYDPDGTIASYFWDFGDGTNSTGIVVSQSYADNGTYTVTLTVTDDDGATDSSSSIKTVLNRAPFAVFTESAETVYAGEAITFDASESYDPDGSITRHLWDFGDGTNGTGITIDYAYATGGTYTVTLTVTDDDGAWDSESSTKTILVNELPVALFNESAKVVYTGEAISFNASASYDPDGYIVSYFWDFGDGTDATGVTGNHAYADDGVYTVTLTVTDNHGATVKTTQTKVVLNRPPVASFTENATTVLTGEVIHFNASSSYDPDGSIVNYVWDFGDGTEGTGVTITHVYADDGVYIVTLTVTDDDETTESNSVAKIVSNRPPVALFTENATAVKKGEFIHFDASESYDPDGSIVSYFWDFGDGTDATGVTADHAYAEDGNYTVTLTVTDDDGDSWSVSAEKTVKTPVAWPLALIGAIGLGIAALTATLLYALHRRRKKRSGSSSGSRPVVTFYVPMKILGGGN